MQLIFYKKYNLLVSAQRKFNKDWIIRNREMKTDARGRPFFLDSISSADQKSTRVPMESACAVPIRSLSASLLVYSTHTRVRLLKLYW